MFKETFIVLYYTIKLIVATSQNKKHIEKNVPWLFIKPTCVCIFDIFYIFSCSSLKINSRI